MDETRKDTESIHWCDPSVECPLGTHELDLNCLNCTDVGACHHIEEVGYCCADCPELEKARRGRTPVEGVARELYYLKEDLREMLDRNSETDVANDSLARITRIETWIDKLEQ